MLLIRDEFLVVRLMVATASYYRATKALAAVD